MTLIPFHDRPEKKVVKKHWLEAFIILSLYHSDYWHQFLSFEESHKCLCSGKMVQMVVILKSFCMSDETQKNSRNRLLFLFVWKTKTTFFCLVDFLQLISDTLNSSRNEHYLMKLFLNKYLEKSFLNIFVITSWKCWQIIFANCIARLPSQRKRSTSQKAITDY